MKQLGGAVCLAKLQPLISVAIIAWRWLLTSPSRHGAFEAGHELRVVECIVHLVNLRCGAWIIGCGRSFLQPSPRRNST